jgi:hypothetical protein
MSKIQKLSNYQIFKFSWYKILAINMLQNYQLMKIKNKCCEMLRFYKT